MRAWFGRGLPSRKVVLVLAFNAAIRLPKLHVTMCSSGSCILLFRGHCPVPRAPKPSGNLPRQGSQYNILLEENAFEEDRIVARFLTRFGFQRCNPNPQTLRVALCSSLGSFNFVVLGNLSHAQDLKTHQGIVPNKVQNQIFMRESDLEEDCIVARSFLTGFGFQRCNLKHSVWQPKSPNISSYTVFLSEFVLWLSMLQCKSSHHLSLCLFSKLIYKLVFLAAVWHFREAFSSNYCIL